MYVAQNIAMWSTSYSAGRETGSDKFNIMYLCVCDQYNIYISWFSYGKVLQVHEPSLMFLPADVLH